MFGEIFKSLTGSFNNFVGGGFLKSASRYAGKYLGKFIERSINNQTAYHNLEYGMIDDFFLPTAAYGQPIALIYGKAKTNATLVWSDNIKEVVNQQFSEKTDRYGLLKDSYEINKYNYFLSCAFVICEGEIHDIAQVWANNKVIDINKYRYRLYKGSQNQAKDPTMSKILGEEKTTAYRGLAYIVFEDLPLADFHNQIPVFSFEVLKKVNNHALQTIEKDINSIMFLQDGGEFCYDTKIILKHKLLNNLIFDSEIINSFNRENTADALYSLNQLQRKFTNIKWISVEVNWFVNSLDIQLAEIKPAVEYRSSDYRSSEAWGVSHYNRDNAYLVAQDEFSNIKFGGSVNDQSLIRFLTELKSRGMKIMIKPKIIFNNLIYEDIAKLTGSYNNLHSFFYKNHGYREFILHYANICKSYIDAFIIGSGLSGITQIKAPSNSFPAVDELIKLASDLKASLPGGVKISYAANHDEYHSDPNSGFYNLDKLWSSDSIDFIGINAYFPLTNIAYHQITTNMITKGWESGELYEYIVVAGERIEIPAEKAPKNISYWWRNRHRNPDGSYTNWQPSSKKIWFTEYGYSSIDKITNQPNISHDNSVLPKYSNGKSDFLIQQTAIKATVKYWQNSEFVDNMFLNGWDARALPNWGASINHEAWEKGRCLNGKLSANNLASIVEDLSVRSGMSFSNFNIYNLDDEIEGIILRNKATIWNNINMLRCIYFFDIISNQNQVVFKKRKDNLVAFIEQKNLLNKPGYYFDIHKISNSQLLNHVKIYHLNKNYSQDYFEYKNDDKIGSTDVMNLPIILQKSEVFSIAKKLLNSSEMDANIAHFRISFSYSYIEPGDLIKVNYDQQIFVLRVAQISFFSNYIDVTAAIINSADINN